MELLAIPDCVLIDLPAGPIGGLLVGEDSQLLRRFGEIQLLSTIGSEEDFRVRHRADELLISLQGELAVELVDVRTQSPTAGLRAKAAVSGKDRKLLLIPCGVAYRISSSDEALTLRVSTHADRGNDVHLTISEREMAAGWMLSK